MKRMDNSQIFLSMLWCCAVILLTGVVVFYVSQIVLIPIVGKNALEPLVYYLLIAAFGPAYWFGYLRKESEDGKKRYALEYPFDWKNELKDFFLGEGKYLVALFAAFAVMWEIAYRLKLNPVFIPVNCFLPAAMILRQFPVLRAVFGVAVSLTEIVILTLWVHKRDYKDRIRELRKRADTKAAAEKPVRSDAEQYIIDRDYYYLATVGWKDRLMFFGLTLLYNGVTYYIVRWLAMVFTSVFGTMESGVAFQVLTTIPAALLIPLLLTFRDVRKAVPKLYSLADKETGWLKKAFSLAGPGEALRFLLGMLPLPFLMYGAITSPLTYLLYQLAYVNPTDRFDEIMVENAATLRDFLVFLAIYAVYYIVYELLLYWKIGREVRRQYEYLTGAMQEREHYDLAGTSYRKRIAKAPASSEEKDSDETET